MFQIIFRYKKTNYDIKFSFIATIKVWKKYTLSNQYNFYCINPYFNNKSLCKYT